jgi:hypothetical protein
VVGLLCSLSVIVLVSCSRIIVVNLFTGIVYILVEFLRMLRLVGVTLVGSVGALLFMVFENALLSLMHVFFTLLIASLRVGNYCVCLT